jgi:hypothetical protein
MAKGKGDDPLLDERRELVGHPWPTPLARTQHFQTLPLNLALPGVVARAMHTKRATRCRNADPAREIKELQPVAEEHVILRHATPPFAWQ